MIQRPIPYTRHAQAARERQALRLLAERASAPHASRFTLWAFTVCVGALFALIFTATLFLP